MAKKGTRRVHRKRHVSRKQRGGARLTVRDLKEKLANVPEDLIIKLVGNGYVEDALYGNDGQFTISGEGN